MAEIVTLTKPNSTDIIYPQTRDTAVYNTQGDPISNVYAPMNSPNLTGTPTAPTATMGTKTTQIATTKFVDNAINNIIVLNDGYIFLSFDFLSVYPLVLIQYISSL